MISLPLLEPIDDFYREVLHITDNATILALVDQGLDSMAGFNQLKPEESTKVCTNIRRLGGMVEGEHGTWFPAGGSH
jgi:hypothetical protein